MPRSTPTPLFFKALPKLCPHSLILISLSLSLNSCHPSSSLPDQNLRPSAQPSASASDSSSNPSNDLGLPDDIAKPSANPSTAPSSLPTTFPSTSPSGYQPPTGSAQITFRFAISDWNPDQATGNPCQPDLVPFTYKISHSGQAQTAQINPADADANGVVDVTVTGLLNREGVTLLVPSVQNSAGLSLFAPISKQVQADPLTPQIVNVSVPVRVWPEANAFLQPAGDDLLLTQDLAPQDNTVIEPGSDVFKGWEVQAGAVPWQDRNLTNIDPYNESFPGLLPLVSSIEVPDTPAGGSATLKVQLKAPQRPGLYRSNWMLQDRSSSAFYLPNIQLFTQLEVGGEALSTPLVNGDAHGVDQNFVLQADGQLQPLPYYTVVYSGSSLQVLYSLKNTGTQVWQNRRLELDSSLASEHQLQVSESSLEIPTTAPGDTARIGPVILTAPNRDAYFAAWRMVNSSGQKLFSGPPAVVTQLSVTALPSACNPQ